MVLIYSWSFLGIFYAIILHLCLTCVLTFLVPFRLVDIVKKVGWELCLLNSLFLYFDDKLATLGVEFWRKLILFVQILSTNSLKLIMLNNQPPLLIECLGVWREEYLFLSLSISVLVWITLEPLEVLLFIHIFFTFCWDSLVKNWLIWVLPKFSLKFLLLVLILSVFIGFAMNFLFIMFFY